MGTTANISLLNRRHRQHGAALVTGLILLLVLTLLAVSGMNSASLEFMMAGNEQYCANAFSAAEAGRKNHRIGRGLDRAFDDRGGRELCAHRAAGAGHRYQQRGHQGLENAVHVVLHYLPMPV